MRADGAGVGLFASIERFALAPAADQLLPASQKCIGPGEFAWVEEFVVHERVADRLGIDFDVGQPGQPGRLVAQLLPQLGAAAVELFEPLLQPLGVFSRHLDSWRRHPPHLVGKIVARAVG